MDKLKEIQYFRSFDVLSIILSFMIVLTISVLVFKKNIEHKKVATANSDVENLAQELILKPVNSSFINGKSDGRGLASTDESLGNDPWGKSYEVRVVKNSYGQPIYLIVVSGGPNNQFDTVISDTVASSHTHMEDFKFVGDDVGYVKAFR